MDKTEKLLNKIKIDGMISAISNEIYRLISSTIKDLNSVNADSDAISRSLVKAEKNMKMFRIMVKQRKEIRLYKERGYVVISRTSGEQQPTAPLNADAEEKDREEAIAKIFKIRQKFSDIWKMPL